MSCFLDCLYRYPRTCTRTIAKSEWPSCVLKGAWVYWVNLCNSRMSPDFKTFSVAWGERAIFPRALHKNAKKARAIGGSRALKNKTKRSCALRFAVASHASVQCNVRTHSAQKRARWPCESLWRLLQRLQRLRRWRRSFILIQSEIEKKPDRKAPQSQYSGWELSMKSVAFWVHIQRSILPWDL